MQKSHLTNSNHLVTVLLPTYNRPESLSAAIDSVLTQRYTQFELIVIRDGGSSVAPIMARYNDSRIRLIDRDCNRGKAASLNEALKLARGKYICYLDDDDRWYANHIELLVQALEENPQYGLAYSDLYKVHYRQQSGGRRQILAKNLEISRDFDRMLMFQFNHVLHVSLMHRRDLLEKAGPYNENLKVLIDWDLTRRLCFYTDFLHLPSITGEYFASVENSDRISVQQRKDTTSYLHHLLTIRATRPPKPWPCVSDLAVILLHSSCDQTMTQSLSNLWTHGYYPSLIYLPMPASELDRLQTPVPNIVKVPVAENTPDFKKIDAVLAVAECDYLAILAAGFPVAADEVSFLERSLYPLIRTTPDRAAYEIVESEPNRWGAVFRKDDVVRLRHKYPNCSIQHAASVSELKVQKPEFKDYPFQFDNFLTAAGQLQRQGRWIDAAKVYESIAAHHGNVLWMQTMRANALQQAGCLEQAEEIIQQVNRVSPSVSRLMIQARIYAKMNNWTQAAEFYQRAGSVLSCSNRPASEPLLQTVSGNFNIENKMAN